MLGLGQLRKAEAHAIAELKAVEAQKGTLAADKEALDAEEAELAAEEAECVARACSRWNSAWLTRVLHRAGAGSGGNIPSTCSGETSCRTARARSRPAWRTESVSSKSSRRQTSTVSIPRFHASPRL